MTQRVERKLEESHAADAGQMLPGIQLPVASSLQKMLDTVRAAGAANRRDGVIRAVAQSIARSVASTASCMLVVFLILLALLWLLMKPLNAIVTRLPLISTVNGLGGAALGLVCGGLTAVCGRVGSCSASAGF